MNNIVGIMLQEQVTWPYFMFPATKNSKTLANINYLYVVLDAPYSGFKVEILHNMQLDLLGMFFSKDIFFLIIHNHIQ
jgi:hypothetical protein